MFHNVIIFASAVEQELVELVSSGKIFISGFLLFRKTHHDKCILQAQCAFHKESFPSISRESNKLCLISCDRILGLIAVEEVFKSFT